MTLLRSASVGAAAGSAATIAMSALMLGAKRIGITGTLPPVLIARDALRAIDHKTPVAEEEHALAAVAHLGFGAAAGALFAILTEGADAARSRWIAASMGMLYASGIWLVSYQGWVPALGIIPRASRDRRGRAATMAVAHLVYGGALGVLTAVLRR